MKKVAINLSYLFLFFFLFFVGCRESDVTAPDTSDQSLKLKRVVLDVKDYSLYRYDGQRVTSYEIFKKDTLNFNLQIFYNNLGQIIKTGSANDFDAYEYDLSGKLIKLNSYKKTGEGSIVYSTASFIYNSNGLMEKVSRTLPAMSKNTYAEYKYDKSGNVIEIKSYSSGVLLAEYFYEYDSGLNPFRNASPYAVESYAGISKNNVTKETCYDYSSGSKTESITYQKYDYNSSNYPVKCFTGGKISSGNNVRLISGYCEFEYY